MKPGRELDVLVADKIFGLTMRDRFSGEERPITAVQVLAHFSNIEMIPRYSTDISAAWVVVEKINSSKNKWTFNSLRCDPNDGKWQFGDIDIDGSIWPDDKYDSAPLAICLAALKAVGVDSASLG